MSATLKLGTDGNWAAKKGSVLSYNDENGNYKPLPFDFTRASSATRVNKDGLIETVGSGQPRIDYKDDSEGALLLEPSRSNTITYSNDFLDSSWNVFRGSVTADVIISPDGTQNASRYEEDSQTGSHLFRRQSLSITNGLSYTGSIFIKKGELSSIILQSNSSSRWVASATFDVENGVVTSGTGEIEDYGNGWYRCSISGNAVQTTTAAGLEMYTSVGAGRDGDGLYMYGAMFEQGYLTSYIPTQGSAVTRLAESCSQTPPDGVIGQTEGVIYWEGIINGTENNFANIVTGERNTTTSFSVLHRKSPSEFQCSVFDGSTKGTCRGGSVVFGEKYKIAYAYKSGDFALYVNGVSVATSTDTWTPPSTIDNIIVGDATTYFGFKESNTNKQIKFYNTRLSNTELQTLTT